MGGCVGLVFDCREEEEEKKEEKKKEAARIHPGLLHVLFQICVSVV